MKLQIEVPDNTEIISVTAVMAEDTKTGVNISTNVYVQALKDFVKVEEPAEAEKGVEDDEAPWE